MIRKTIIATALAALTLTSAACNTVKGLGEDIQSVGEAGEDVINGDG
ncbi:MAG: entericidin A/B family lipoprotein [Pseudomonadota bacterium]